jgi:hypothetical protein
MGWQSRSSWSMLADGQKIFGVNHSGAVAEYDVHLGCRVLVESELWPDSWVVGKWVHCNSFYFESLVREHVRLAKRQECHFMTMENPR